MWYSILLIAALFVWAAYRRIKDGKYPDLVCAVFRPFQIFPNYKTGSFWANLGGGINQHSLQKASSQTVGLFGTIGFGLVVLSLISGLIAFETFTKMSNNPIFGLFVASVIVFTVWVIDRQNFSSIFRKESMGEPVTWKILWPRFVLIIALGMFDGLNFMMSRSEQPITKIMETHAREDVQKRWLELDAEIATNLARKEPINTSLEIAEQKCEVYAINKEIARLNTLKQTAITNKGNEGAGVGSDRTSGDVGMGARYRVREQEIQDLDKAIAEQQALLVTAPSSLNCQAWEKARIDADTALALIDQEDFRLRSIKISENTRLMDPQRNCDFFKWWDAFLEYLSQSWGRIALAILFMIIVMGFYMAATIAAKLFPHTDFHDIVKAEAEQALETAEAEILNTERVRRETARIKATAEIEEAQLEYEKGRRSRLADLDQVLQNQQGSESSISNSRVEITESQRKAAEKLNASVAVIGISHANSARLALAADMEMMNHLVSIKAIWIANLLALEPGLDTFIQQKRWNEYYKTKMGLI